MKRTYLIVGHSGGIGFAIAKSALALGHAVIGLSRRASGLSSPDLVEIGADVLEVDLATVGIPATLDGLVYCPGTINLRPFRSLQESDYLDDFRISALGAVRVLQAAGTALKAGQHAGVVLFSTDAVQQGMAFHASVAMAKGAVEGLTRSLAAEWAPSIRVNALAPSLTQTPLTARMLTPEARIQASRDRHPLRQIVNPKTWPAPRCSCWVTRPSGSPAKYGRSTAGCRRCGSDALWFCLGLRPPRGGYLSSNIGGVGQLLAARPYPILTHGVSECRSRNNRRPTMPRRPPSPPCWPTVTPCT